MTDWDKAEERGSLPIEDLELLLDLYGRIERGQTIKQVEEAMKGKWGGGSPTYYRKLAALERIIRPRNAAKDWQLIIRRTGKPHTELNDAAPEFFRRLGEIVDLYREVLAPLDEKHEQVTVACTNVVAVFYLPSVLRSSTFLANHPHARIRTRQGEYWDILRYVKEGLADFGIGPAGAEIPGDCAVKEFRRIARGLLYNPKAIKLAKPIRRKRDLRQLQAHTVLLLEHGLQRDFDMERYLPSPTSGRRRYLPTFAELYAWAKAGLGVAVVHETQHLLGDTSLEFISIPALGSTPVCYFLRKPGEKALRPEARKLLNSFKKWKPGS